MLVFIPLIGLGVILMMKAGGLGGTSGAGVDTNPLVIRSNPWNLPDIDSSNQGGGFATTYDESFEKASGATGVPFALVKAHAIRESSLNPSATHSDSGGNSSFGLLQVEWNEIPGTLLYDRLGKYGSEYEGANLSPVILEDPDTSAFLGASIMQDNLNWLKGNLADAINAYNTGTPVSGIPAPANYVADVLKYYSQIVGETVS